jgi:NAD(P)-dependent dehydrogenase (short-subunit alcohol dehydrogenase family)
VSKTILITGASSGLGRDTAGTLFRAGHTVYASMRSRRARTERGNDLYSPWDALQVGYFLAALDDFRNWLIRAA